ncbi:fatty acid synthase alpha subunit Lsd1, partial [Coemansia guatemalensis]
MSNGFRMVDGAEPLRAGDVVESRAKIVEVTIEETGKRSRIRGHVFRDGKPVVEVTTSFFYRGAFTDFANTFRNPMRLTLESTRDIAVLRSKEWFVPLEAGHELQAGAILEFQLESQYRFKSSTMYSRITTKGRVSTKEYVHIADVAYECGESYGNPVVEYLRRHGQSIEDSYYFENGGYSVMPRGSEFSSITHSPGTNEPYSNISNDHNPIHTNSASTRKFVETFAADNHPERVRAYDVEFVGMVLPNDQLETKLSHVGMKDGRKLINVLEGMAEVEQPITGYTFTGQGSQEPGMGMDLYERSETARHLWDRADRHMRETFGISIIDIRTVYFGGDKGAKIRSNYCSLTYETVDQEGNAKVLRLFPDIVEDSPSFTFKSPSGLLQATQFTQPALMLFELASYADMRANAIGGVLAVEAVVEVCFYRGMTMQRAVERDALNRSQYSMMAVNPARVGKSFGQQALDFVIGSIRHQGKGLLEIVNHNVENWQYIDVSKLIQEMPLEAVQEQLGKIIDGSLAKADEKRERDGFIHLERGQSTIPLLGIDLRVNDINYSLLKHLYIPNLTARPFEVSRDYFEEVHEMTGSARIARALKNWDDGMLADPAEVQRLSHVMLIELLAYQFASPRFIEFGPSPTLCGMAQRTLKFKYEAYDDAIAHRRSTLCYSKNEKELYYSYDPEPEPEAQPAESATKTEAPAAPAAAAAAAPLKKPLDEVPVSKSVKELVGGKSTLQNEILGDLQKEFGSDVPEKSEETPLSELADSMTSEAEAKAWLDTLAQAYAKKTGISYSSASSASGGGAAGGAVAVVNSEAFDKAQREQNRLVTQQLEVLARYLGIDLRKGDRAFEVDREITSQCIRLMNRSNPALMRYMAYHIAKTDVSKGETYKLARDYAQMLYENCEVALNHPPTKVTASGDIEYAEVQRSDERKLLDYVRKMQAGGELTQFSGRQRVEQNLAKIYRIIKQQNSMKKDSKLAIQGMYADVLRALHIRSRASAEGSGPAAELPEKETIPFLHLKRKTPTGEWEFNSKLTGTYLDVLTEMCKSGQTFENKN